MSKKTVNVVIIAPTFIDGDLHEPGVVLKDHPTEDAMSLVGSGKARLAKDEDLAAAAAEAKKK